MLFKRQQHEQPALLSKSPQQLQGADVCCRMLTYAGVCWRQQVSSAAPRSLSPSRSPRQHTSACVSIRQHTSVSIREQSVVRRPARSLSRSRSPLHSATILCTMQYPAFSISSKLPIASFRSLSMPWLLIFFCWSAAAVSVAI